MAARALMFQGTGSDVGKSVLVAGLCRLFANQGLAVRPFKPQNMSNNAAVTIEGGEIGRAQALQARACRVEPSVDMNPVLLKPQSETGAQLIVAGRMRGAARAREYQALKPGLMPDVLAAFRRLSSSADLVLVEGAGSASEVNLRAGDIANMGFARAAEVPVVLVGDIDRGGVIASLVGTKHVLEPADAAMIRGFLVNKMRGDPTLFDDGLRFVSERTGWPALGLVPWFERARELPAEDSLGLAGSIRTPRTRVRVAVPVLPFVANHDDLDPLKLEPEVELILVRAGDPWPAGVDLVILPGSKSTIADLAALRARGWDGAIRAHAANAGRVLGICGGYQMLGTAIADPQGIEGPPARVAGLGLLDVETVLTGDKRLAPIHGRALDTGAGFRGYEMHVGVTSGPDAVERPALVAADGRRDGARSRDGRIVGVFVHGVLDHPEPRGAWLSAHGARSAGVDHGARVDAAIDALAEHLEHHVDVAALLALAGTGRGR